MVRKYSLGFCCVTDSKQVRESVESLIKRLSMDTVRNLSAISWSEQTARLLRGHSKLLNLETGPRACKEQS